MRKNEPRKIAEKTFLKDRGRITNKELAKQLGVHPATVARWKKLDEWDVKLVQSVTGGEESGAGETDFYQVDLRHIGALNERIDAYLQKKETPTVGDTGSRPGKISPDELYGNCQRPDEISANRRL